MALKNVVDADGRESQVSEAYLDPNAGFFTKAIAGLLAPITGSTAEKYASFAGMASGAVVYGIVLGSVANTQNIGPMLIPARA